MRPIKTMVFLFLCVPGLLSAAWVPYNFFQVGTKGMGIGGAFTSLADDLGAFYANPAGIVQVQKPSLSYQLYSALRVQRLIDTSLRLEWEYFPLIAYAQPFGANMAGGVFVQTLFKSPAETYSVHGIGINYSVRLGDHLAWGVNTGIAVGHQQDNWSSGWFFQTGLLAVLKPTLRAGMVLRFPIRLSWDELRGDIDVDEVLPWSAQAGLSWRLSKTAIFSVELEYQGWSSIRYSSSGTDLSPGLNTGLFKSWHPHIGFQFLHERSGAQLRFGVMTIASASSSGLDAQPVLTLGLGAYTGEFFRLDFALLDTLIFDIFTRTDRFEQFLLSFEYTF